MPTYNDPAFGQAVNNIAKMFAPPDAQSLYLTGKGAREQAEVDARRKAIASIDPKISPYAAIAPEQFVSNLGKILLTVRAAQEGMTPEGLVNAQIGAGEAYDNTVAGRSAIEGGLNSRNAATIAAENARHLQSEAGLDRRSAAQRQADIAKVLIAPLNKDQSRQDVTSVARMYGLPANAAGPAFGIQERDAGKDYVLPSGEFVQSRVPPGTPEFTPGVAAIAGPDGKPQEFNAAFDKRTGAWLLPGGRPLPEGAVAKPVSGGGGMSFEVGKDGTVRFVQGNNAGMTNARVTDLQRQEAENARGREELIALRNSLGAADVGVAGIGNEMATTYGAQVVPGMARPDVVSRRTQMRTTTAAMAKALMGDERLSDGDRRVVEALAPSTGIDESDASVKAKLDALIVMTAYREQFANRVRAGGQLPPLNGAALGALVDAGKVPPDVAQSYAQNVLSPRAQGGPGITQGPMGAAINGLLTGQPAPAPAPAPAPPAAPPAADLAVLRAQAQQVIQGGADPAAVAARFKQMTGQDL